MATCIFPPTFATNRFSPRRTRTSKRTSSVPAARPAPVEMSPVPDAPGKFQADWNADKPGSYVTEVVAQRGDQEIGRDVLTFQRMDGVAENFHTEQNRDLLEKLASQTGGRYWRPEELSKLPDGNSLFRRGHHHARDERALEYARDLSAADLAAVLGMAAAPEVGCGVKTRAAICSVVARSLAGERFPRAPESITSPWRAWAASPTTSSASPPWPTTSTSC